MSGSSARMNGSTQRAVAEFLETHGLEVPIETRLLDLVSEVGELSKEALKGAEYGCKDFTPPDGWTGELADVLFALVCLANSTHVDLEAALGEALEKYEERLTCGGDAGSGR